VFQVAFCPENIAACPDCDLLQRIPALPDGEMAYCPRCGRTLAESKIDSLRRTLAFTIAAAIVLIIANSTPLLGLSAVGRRADTTILGGVLLMWQHGQEITALLVAFCTVIAPSVYIVVMLTVLMAINRTPVPSWIRPLLGLSEFSKSWSMVEVMMLGILVALVKIADLATVLPGIGMFAVFALILLLASISVSFDPREVWIRIPWADANAKPALPGFAFENPTTVGDDFAKAATGGQLGLVACRTCSLLIAPPDVQKPGRCPRCGAKLALRHAKMFQRSWALLLAAAICYIPANLLPVMNTTTPGYEEKDTIISGVILLYETGSWPLALIVLIASVMIPLAKIIALAYLLLTIQFRRNRGRQERIRLYRLVEVVGRWSMLDVFVVTFVVALVQLQPLMSVEPGAGVLFFAAVVVLTMLAAENFDPRSLWDPDTAKENNS
jgi:paraquat-inducible protein A